MTPSQLRPLALVGAALAAAALLFAVAIADGGYDIVDRQSIGVVLWWLVGLGALVASRGPARPGLSGLLVIAFGAGIALWIGMNVGHSTSQERSVVELGRAVTHLAPVVLIGWVLPTCLWRGVFLGLTIGAVAVLIAALGNRLSPGFLGQTDAIVFVSDTSRLASPLGYWNGVGSWGVVTALLLLATSAHASTWWQRALAIFPLPLAVAVVYLTYSRSSIGAALVGLVVMVALSRHRWTLALHALAAGVAGLVVVGAIRSAPEIAEATGSDGSSGLIATLVGAGAVLALVVAGVHHVGVDRVALPLRLARIVLVVGGVFAIAGGAIAASQYGPDAWDKFTTIDQTAATDPTNRLKTLSNGYRVAQWRIALESWEDAKLRGTGAGTFELTYNLRADDSQFIRDAHSAFLEALSEQGVIGLLLLVGLVGSTAAAVIVAVRRAVGAVERGLIAGAGAGLVAFTFGTAFDWFWEVSALALLAMALTGVVVAAGKPESKEREVDAQPEASATSTRESREGGWAMRASLVATAILAVLVLLPGLVGTSEVRRSQQAVNRSDLAAARASADEAIGIQPWASSPFLQRGLVDERDGQWTSARRALQLAIERDPYDWRLPLVLARIEAKAGEPEAAIKAYREAKRLRPNGQFFQ